MTPERFQALRRSFEEFLELNTEQRERALHELAASDPPLAAELRRLLQEHGRSTALLDESPVSGIQTEQRQWKRLGPYTIEREIGSGGMGVVYEAVRVEGSFRKRVAIKVLRRNLSRQTSLARFDHERQILARLEHPHIATIFDVGETPEGDPYFVMEYVDGEPITRYAQARRLSVNQRLDLFLQACDAVQCAHRNLTVHRDLKPGNILVTPSGAVKLLDFGVAKLLESEQTGAAEPPTEVLLTPAYSSPEQIRREPASTSGDIFQLGILLYEMLSGRHPFESQRGLPHETMRAICEDDPPPPSTIPGPHARQLCGELDTIILTALRKQPAWRYPSAEQLAEDIGRYRRGWPILAKGNSAAYRLRKFVRRQWLPLASTAAVILLLAGGIVATTQEARIANAARAQAERERAAAEEARRAATEQRQVAEARRQEAENERQRAQERYLAVRSLASSLLFDLYDGVRDLAGSSTARRLMVAKAQHQLELLSADAGHDIGLQRDLAASYERMGELRVGPGRGGQNDGNAAVAAYREAVRLRRAIAARPDAVAGDRRDLALGLTKLGDGEFFAGDPKQALGEYQSAESAANALAHSHPADLSMRRALGTVQERLCIMLFATGNTVGALEACRQANATLSPLALSQPDDLELQRLLATTEGSYANAFRLSGKPRDAVTHANAALEALNRLEALAPSNAEYRRLAASAQTILAGSLAATGDIPASTAAFDRAIRAMEIAVEIDPSDLGSPLRLAGTLLAFSRRLAQGPETSRAHDTARKAMLLLQQTAEKPNAGPVEWNEYADALLKVDFADLQGSAKALQLAEKSVAATQRRNPFFLDTLAWAYFRSGDKPKAVETEREALRLVPADAKGGIHDVLTEGLNNFLASGK